MSELTDEQIKVWLGEVYGYAVYTVYPREKHVARSAYALGREDASNFYKQQVEQLTVSGIHTCHEECPRVACVLRREVEKLKAERDEASDLCAAISDSAAMYLAEIERLREVLENVQHGTVCPAQPGWLDAGPCTCGLDAALIAKPDGECQSCVDGQCTVGDDCVAVSNPPEPYDVTCARCGKTGLSSEFIVEEGDEWECPPCYDREDAREAALIAAPGGGRP